MLNQQNIKFVVIVLLLVLPNDKNHKFLQLLCDKEIHLYKFLL